MSKFALLKYWRNIHFHLASIPAFSGPHIKFLPKKQKWKKFAPLANFETDRGQNDVSYKCVLEFYFA
jgi:hypothetical protein